MRPSSTLEAFKGPYALTQICRWLTKMAPVLYLPRIQVLCNVTLQLLPSEGGVYFPSL